MTTEELIEILQKAPQKVDVVVGEKGTDRWVYAVDAKEGTIDGRKRVVRITFQFPSSYN